MSPQDCGDPAEQCGHAVASDDALCARDFAIEVRVRCDRSDDRPQHGPARLHAK
jgi:hypothetical protein